VATDDVRPDAAREISPGIERAYLAPLPVRRLPGVCRETQAQLHDIGIRQVRAM
jgi:DNA polymerase-4